MQLGMIGLGRMGANMVHRLLAAGHQCVVFDRSPKAVGPVSGSGRRPWRRWIDTFLDSPHDIIDWEHAPLVPGQTYRAEPRSVVVLFAGLEADGGR